jgi:hypothetical protein
MHRTWIQVIVSATMMTGAVMLAGCGGKSGTDPICDLYPESCTPILPVASASIDPLYATALVGTSVTYTARTVNVSTVSVGYQWLRSSDGGKTYVEISGATGISMTVPAVNLADDGAMFLVQVKPGNSLLVAQAPSHPTVSGTPGIVFQDGEFLDANWLIAPLSDANEPAPVDTEQHVDSGGNPGAWRASTFKVQGLSGRVFYSSLASIYDPSKQGAINVVDYAEEWTHEASRGSLTPDDFMIFDGPACGVGESCPDFSATAAPMRFGYFRIAFGVAGDSIGHGIDNWRVTVWRR